MSSNFTTLIIGIGNKYRGDDAAGLEVVQALRGKLPVGIIAIEETGEGTALVEAWKGAESVIVVDAIESGSPPGTVRRIDATSQKLPHEIFNHSSHAFGLSAAIELARALNELPSRLIVYGIEGKNFAAGDTFSPAVEGAIAICAAQLRAELQAEVALSETIDSGA